MPPPLRILHLTSASEPGGLSRYLLDLSTAMRAAGHRVAIAGERGGWHERFMEAEIPWVDVPLGGGPLALLRSGRILRDWLKQNPVDVLHAHYRRSLMVAARLRGAAAAPVLYTLHLSDIPTAGLRLADRIHVPSADGKNWLSGIYPADRISVIPHGVDVEKFCVPDEAARRAARDALKISENEIAAMYVGRLDDPKNVDWLLDFAPAQVRIFIAGDGPLRETLEKRAGKRVQFLGERDPVAIYHAADALLLPSAREGFSLACAEAMSCGVPVLRTRTSGTSELIRENVTGRSTAIDREEFLSAAVEFLSSREELRRMGTAAAAHIRESFTFSRQLERTLGLYYFMAGLSTGGVSSGSSSTEPAGSAVRS